MASSEIRPSVKKNLNCREEADLIIIGAGPAGLFCAIKAAGSIHDDRKKHNSRIIVLEKKGTPGRKLLISGSGRSNITHGGDIQEFFSHYGEHGRFLRPALLSFKNKDIVSFFAEKGLAMIEEESGKIFPATGRSKDVLDILVRECEARRISLQCGQKVLSISKKDHGLEDGSENGSEDGFEDGSDDRFKHGIESGFEVATEDGSYRSPLLVIATGGCSYPATGSSGDGYRFARDLGHNIIEPGPALTPIFIKDYPFRELAGVSIPDVQVSLQHSEKTLTNCGDILFTHEGLSGPAILDFSRYIMPGDTVRLSLMPQEKRRELEAWFLKSTKENGGRSLKTLLEDLPPAFCRSAQSIPGRLTAKILEISGIPAELKGSQLSRHLRITLLNNLTGLPLQVARLGGWDIAMVSRGGVDLQEINSRTMESRLVKGLYLVGEVLDVDGDTGGYNLQAAFSTGALAAGSIAKKLARSGLKQA
ncbi:MAG: NAD(P)/FAD-dependent oxidoreductase [Methanothrix sp.]